MTIQQLQYVIAIAEAGSMNKAAERLYVSQPTLTGAIKDLEKEVGFSIFYRGGRGVTLTPDGSDLIPYAKAVLQQYERLQERIGGAKDRKRKFGVSTQHYSFAVKAFVELVREYDTARYEFAIRETRTKDVIADVAEMRSEIGILYLSDFNRAAIQKLLRSSDLEFHPLINCDTYVYLWKGHPLAEREVIRFEDLREYPCLAFEQGDAASFYYSEEILSTEEYQRVIKACDRATMLNLMVGLNGYTLCSGIICEELNGSDFLAVPFAQDSVKGSGMMEIGYVTRRKTGLSSIGAMYIGKIKEYLGITEL